MKIQYKNVGSIRDAEVEFKPQKLTLIKGPTNNGKSLMFYSMSYGLLNNPAFKHFINNKALEENQKAYEQITIIDDRNDKFEIKAGTNYLQYKYNDNEPYQKVQRKTFFDVSQKSIYGLLYFPDEDYDKILNIVGEDSGLFPINHTDSQIFKLYENLLCLSSSQDILRQIKLDQEDFDYRQKEITQTIQKYEEQQVKINSALDIIDENKLNEIENTLKYYNDNYTRLIDLYNNVIKDVNYINKYNSIQYTNIDFDVQKFSRLLNILIQSNSLNNAQSLLNVELIEPEKIDLQKIINIQQNYSNALLLSQEINNLNSTIDNDTKELNNIIEKMKDVKICPLCGQMMEGK